MNKNSSSLSLNSLKDNPSVSLQEAIKKAERLVSDRVGIISKVEFEKLDPDDPRVFFARSYPAEIRTLIGRETLNFGDAASVDPNRAIMKAVGESVERYCSAHYQHQDLRLATYEELGKDAVSPESFALFSKRQYSEPEFPFEPLTSKTPLRWVKGFCLGSEKEVWVPAAFIYVPYQYKKPQEPYIHYPISTGLACASNLSAGIYKGMMEVIERDALMIVWHNRLPCPGLNLSSIDDPFAKSLLKAIEGLPIQCHASILTLDIPVPVILVIITSTSGEPPYITVGISADLNPKQAFISALEEALLTFLGMKRYAKVKSDFKPASDFRNVDTMILHSLAYATSSELRSATDFLTQPATQLSLDELPNTYDDSMVKNVKTVVKSLTENGLDVKTVDLTTPDINEVGFKVVRAVIPGMQPLDINHSYRYLGGTRLYNVPCKTGHFKKPLSEKDLNPYPHPFP